MKKSNLVATIFLGVFFFVAISYSMIAFNNTVIRELEKSASSNLVDLANQQQLSLNRQLENMVYSISTMAETLPIIGVAEGEILEYINSKKEVLNFETVLVIDNAGSAFVSTGKLDDVSQKDYYKAAMEGTIFATEPHQSKYTEKTVVTVAVPIYVEGKIDGVLAVEYCTDYLATLLTTFTDERGLNLIINQDSEIMLTTNSHVLSFDAFRNAEFSGDTTFEGIISDFKEGKSGSISYSIGGERKLGEYRPIEINDWILFFEISEESLNDSVQNISNNMIFTSAMIMFFAFATIIYVVVNKNNTAKALEQVAYYDELTGIPNLIKFKLLVAEAIAKDPQKKYTMVKMDMVNFKAVNEMFGFDAGNKVICAIANTGKSVENKSFIQARVASEEFMFFSESVIFENLEESSKGYERRFKSLLPELADHQFSFRYGRYFLSPGESNVNNIINKTNIAHSYAKKGGSGSIWDYDENFTKKVLRDTEIANKMHKALEHNEFKVFLQPKYNVIKEKVLGAEALVRWVEQDGGMVFPNEFIPLFEQNGFIVELDRYMLKNVCKTLSEWANSKKELIPISVNFSRLHLSNKNFVKEIKDIVSSYGVETKYIEIELTESTVMENEKELKSILKSLHREGFLVSIDDFGSGYSSLGMLKNFKVDTLKLDRSFFVEIEDDEEQGRGDLVVESIIRLANNLGMHTVAEGIEEKYQENFLKKIGCESAQGYYFSKPLPVAEFEKLFVQ